MISSHSKKDNLVKSRELSQNKHRNSLRANDFSDIKIPRDKKLKSDIETGNFKDKDNSESASQFEDKLIQNFTTPNLSSAGPGNVNVVCRFRPLNETEKANPSSSEVCAEFSDSTEVKIKSADGKQYKFSFDRIFDISTRQIDVFNASAKPILESVLEGFNGTILTYGQTSSGKTFTMEGVCGNHELEGIIPRTIKHVFEFIRDTTEDSEFTVKVSMVEIYMEKIKDLIEPTRNNLNIREDRAKGIYIEDLSEHYVACEEEVLDLMKIGSDNRTIGQTKMNEHSSRSHSIFVMTIYQNNVKQMTAKTGKLFLVDLAGSEKISKTGATGLTLEQAKNINKSLTTLGMVINNLTDGKSNHIPYRDSKLTRVLQESLGGNSKTCLIITCSPSIFNHHESISTLRFGERAKRIKNKPKINKEVTVAELKIEIENLEKIIQKGNKRILQLGQFIEKNNLKVPAEDDFSFMQEAKLLESLTNLDVINDDNDNLIINEEIKFNNEDLLQKNKGEYGTSTPRKKTVGLGNENLYTLGKLKFSEDDKKNVSESLENAINVINQFSLPDDEKVCLQKELEAIKNKHELLEQQLYEKINELQEKLDLENRAINKVENKSNLTNNINSIDTGNMGQKPISGFNLQDDKYDIFEESSNNAKAAGLSSNLNANLYSLTEAEGEIIKKIKEIQAELNDEDFKNLIGAEKNIDSQSDGKVKPNNNVDLVTFKNVQKVKVIELFEMINEKIFNGIGINYDFEDNQNINKKQEEITLNDNLNLKENIENMTIEKTDHQIIVDANQQANTVIQNNMDLVNEKIQKTTEEILKKERKKFDNEKKIIIKNLEEKNSKIDNLDKENKELKDRIKLLELKMSPDDKNFMKKIISLEKNLEQVNLMYHQVVTQKSVLKIENQVLEKKIKKQKEKLQLSEKENHELVEQIRIKEEKINIISKAHKINNPPSNVIRIIRGGTMKPNAQIQGSNAQESSTNVIQITEKSENSN